MATEEPTPETLRLRRLQFARQLLGNAKCDLLDIPDEEAPEVQSNPLGTTATSEWAWRTLTSTHVRAALCHGQEKPDVDGCLVAAIVTDDACKELSQVEMKNLENPGSSQIHGMIITLDPGKQWKVTFDNDSEAHKPKQSRQLRSKSAKDAPYFESQRFYEASTSEGDVSYVGYAYAVRIILLFKTEQCEDGNLVADTGRYDTPEVVETRVDTLLYHSKLPTNMQVCFRCYRFAHMIVSCFCCQKHETEKRETAFHDETALSTELLCHVCALSCAVCLLPEHQRRCRRS